MSVIVEWLTKVMAAALISAVALAITPDSGVKKALRLICGLVVTIAALSPFADFNFESFAKYSMQYRNEAATYAAALDVENGKIMKSIIESEAAAYILDKAAAMGAESAVASVTVVQSDGSDYPYPWAAEISGIYTQEQKQRLSRVIEGELGIPIERQDWNGV